MMIPLISSFWSNFSEDLHLDTDVPSTTSSLLQCSSSNVSSSLKIFPQLWYRHIWNEAPAAHHLVLNIVNFSGHILIVAQEIPNIMNVQRSKLASSDLFSFLTLLCRSPSRLSVREPLPFLSHRFSLERFPPVPRAIFFLESGEFIIFADTNLQNV